MLTSLMEDARIVVSDMGDILSPKNAPQITAPAVIADGIPKLFPIPIIATPAVPIVPLEVPQNRETMEHNSIAVTKKNLGLIILMP